jgi:hypothetical protein
MYLFISFGKRSPLAMKEIGIVPVYKTGDKTVCSSGQGISLL